MTKEEAIKKIKSLCHGCVEFPHCVNTDPDCFKALEMAIDSIKTDSTIKEAYNKGYKDGQEALAVHLELCKEEGTCDYYDTYNKTCRRSDVPKEPCEDCISFPKGTLKKRGKGYVAYNYAWLKENWQTELKAMGIDAITIPKGATRRDLHKLVFGIDVPELHSDKFRCAREKGCSNCKHKDNINCDMVWWNSPYRKEQE